MSTLTVNFTNHSGIQDTVLISIGFFQGSPTAGQQAIPFSIINLKDQSVINPLDDGSGTYPKNGNWYTLDRLAEGVSISSFSGRIYVCYGNAWIIQYKNYEPGQAVTDPNFYLRYDKMEITFTGSPNDVADLTSIDYWSIPMTLSTYLSTKSKTSPVQTVTGLLNGTTAEKIYTVLNALSTPPVSAIAGPGGTDGAPMPSLVPGSYQQFGTGPSPMSSFARIIGPSSYPAILPLPGGIPVQPYDLFNDYLAYLNATFGPGTTISASIVGLGNGVIALIQGQFAGVGSPPPSTGPQSRQQYSLTAVINSNYDIVLTGSVGGANTTMLYTYASLINPTGIYGGNAPFYLNSSTTQTAPANDVYGWIGGDLFSGFNIGAIGSTTKINDSMVGAMPSQSWFTIKPENFFGGLQTRPNFFNQWAATLAQLSQAYNFAFTDRFAHVLTSLNPATVDTLEIVLEDTSEIS